jgi:hypothetical protein
MIKPGTLCMIRGVPLGTRGADCNGKIVVVEGLQDDIHYGILYKFVPELHTKIPVPCGVDTSPAHYLHPLDNPTDDALDTHSTRLETQ